MGFLIGFIIFLGVIILYLVVIIFFPIMKVKKIPITGQTQDNKIAAPSNRSDVEYEVCGSKIRGWLYLPEKQKDIPYPSVIMCHGFNGTKDLKLEQYALRFAEAGWASLVIDYRHYGESEGEPRQLYDAGKQMEDQHGAVDFMRARKEIDPGRIVLWGTSASGLYGICSASEDHMIAGVIAQCAALDHKEDSKKHVERLGYGFFIRVFVHGQRDKGRMRFNLSPHMIPAYSNDGTISMISVPNVIEGVKSLVEGPSNFKNEICARSLLSPHPPDPITSSKNVKCPVLLLVCERDEIVSPLSHCKVEQNLGEYATVKKYPIGHFEVYSGEHFEKAADDMVDFLQTKCQGS
jgi:pimeloyl-ACP methyl ester carboxylesterase